MWIDPAPIADDELTDGKRSRLRKVVSYRPSGQEIAPAAHLIRMVDALDVHHALIVGTHSGDSTDNRILLDALPRER